jgi:hypothetical protein
VPVGENTLSTANVGQMTPRRILFEEIERARTSLLILGIGFSGSNAELQWKAGRSKRPPYLCCYYNTGDLGNVHIEAFSVPLLGDWELMEKDMRRYQQPIHSAIRSISRGIAFIYPLFS